MAEPGCNPSSQALVFQQRRQASLQLKRKMYARILKLRIIVSVTAFTGDSTWRESEESNAGTLVHTDTQSHLFLRPSAIQSHCERGLGVLNTSTSESLQEAAPCESKAADAN